MAEAQPGQVQGVNIKAPIFTFRDNVKDFARPNLFQVEVFAPPVLQDAITPQPGGVSGSTAEVLETSAGGSQLNAASANAFGTFLVKAANIPASVVGVVNVPYRGRQLKIAGDRTFEPWTVTIINDTDFAVRDSMERWLNGINNHKANAGLTNPVDYQADLIVDQLDRDGNEIKTYNFRGAFPVNISNIELSYETVDTIEEFTVEFQIQYWESNTTS